MQVYSARLRVHARLSGLRRLMYYHPLLSGVVGTAATFCSLAAVFLLVWLRSAELPVQVRRRGRAGGQAERSAVWRSCSLVVLQSDSFAVCPSVFQSVSCEEIQLFIWRHSLRPSIGPLYIILFYTEPPVRR